MNVRHLASLRSSPLDPSCWRPACSSRFTRQASDLSNFRRIEPQYIAALGDPGATSGSGAQSWGLWSQDPGPRGCKLDRYPQLKAAGAWRRHSGNSTLRTGGSRNTA